MSEIISIFQKKANFINESFYYFLPNFNQEKKKIIGEKIIKFKGVKIYTIYFLLNKIIYFIFNKIYIYFYILQLISFSLKENINILIDNKNIISSEKFKQEILYNGNVYFYDEDNIYCIKCLNKKVKNPDNYKCFEMKGKKLIIFNFFLQFFGKLLKNLMKMIK